MHNTKITRRHTLIGATATGLTALLASCATPPDPAEHQNLSPMLSGQDIKEKYVREYTPDGEIKKSDLTVKRKVTILQDWDSGNKIKQIEKTSNRVSDYDTSNYAGFYKNFITFPTLTVNIEHDPKEENRVVNDEELKNLGEASQTGNPQNRLVGLPTSAEYFASTKQLPIIESETGTTVLTGVLKNKALNEYSACALALGCRVGDPVHVSNDNDTITFWKVAQKSLLQHGDLSVDRLVEAGRGSARVLHIVVIEDYSNLNSKAYMISCLPEG